MAYTSSKLKLFRGGVINEWVYDTADTVAAVTAASYITDAVAITNGAIGKGMRPGDIVLVRRFSDTADDTTFAGLSFCAVSSVNATTGAATLKLLDSGAIGTATATAGAATLNATRGIVTTESLTTAAAAEYTLTLTNSAITTSDFVTATVDANGSAGTPGIGGCTVSSGQVVITVTNLHASSAFNAALKIGFQVHKA